MEKIEDGYNGIDGFSHDLYKVHWWSPMKETKILRSYEAKSDHKAIISCYTCICALELVLIFNN